MGLFGKKWDLEKDKANRAKMQNLFNELVEDKEGYKLVYGFNVDVKNMNYVVMRKTTYTYKSIVVGYRESDMSIITIDTVPEFDVHGDIKKYTPQDLRKAKRTFSGEYCLYKQGGMMAGYDAFSVAEIYDEDELFAYLKQEDEAKDFAKFWKKFPKRLQKFGVRC